ncbi:MAG: dihydrolipoyl dehydrogenase [Nitrospina sp.]|jgi:dihydrolipoamide dehydrogenase|nr:dihydrolipoyl dehydrogenase [Nitrospina sp.]MBT3875790.1 dihydrolipoyl dehydrogenase [Nitrospina sp.]MBT4049237.1 dihydrolipoyl dehydrogenase [Nitrospina sp.]MBT4557205.1 dihydrolipoyl dehydrogenase [Nitrospina sp.]MBT5349387.1 dihydrolipoyl dehydrogenase [Nitrospina sp.]
MDKKRVVVLGGGPGGYTAAFLAADLGMKVTLVDENPKPGGVCLHKGCIPSKSLLHLSKLIEETRDAEAFGVKFQPPEIDLNRIRDWNSEVINKMANGLVSLCKQRGVEFVQGRARLLDSHSLMLNDKDKIGFDYCILATGSQPVCPPLFSNIGKRLLTSTTALELEEIPENLLIVGGGYIGLEMGTVYASLGSRVTVVEMTRELLPGVDRDLVRVLLSRLKTKFKDIYLNTQVVSCKLSQNQVSVQFDGPENLIPNHYDRVLIAVGRKPNTTDIGLETTKIKTDEKGFIIVDKQFQTAEPSIFAIGDVIGGAMLAHKASAEGKAVVEVLAGENCSQKKHCVPAVVFTDPEIAWCGLTETEAKNSNRKIQVAKFPWGASGRAQTLGRQEGVTKLILDPDTEEILGVGISGVGAGELIGEGVLAVDHGLKAKDLAQSIHPHPTLSETIMESAEAFYGKATHIYKKPRK